MMSVMTAPIGMALAISRANMLSASRGCSHALFPRRMMTDAIKAGMASVAWMRCCRLDWMICAYFLGVTVGLLGL